MEVRSKLDKVLGCQVRVHGYIKSLDVAYEVFGILEEYPPEDMRATYNYYPEKEDGYYNYRVMSEDRESHLKFPAEAVKWEDGKPDISNLGDQGYGEVWFIDLKEIK